MIAVPEGGACLDESDELSATLLTAFQRAPSLVGDERYVGLLRFRLEWGLLWFTYALPPNRRLMRDPQAMDYYLNHRTNEAASSESAEDDSLRLRMLEAIRHHHRRFPQSAINRLS